MVAGIGVFNVSAVICHRGCAQLLGVMVEAWMNAQITGSRNRMIIAGGRESDIFCLLNILFVVHARVSSAVMRANRLHAQGVLEPNGRGERTINNSNE